MTSFPLALALAAAIALPSLPYASEIEAEERIEHYTFEEPDTLGAAQQLYHEHMGMIRYILRSQELNHSQLEAIHEQSYALEAAVETFEKLKSYDREKLEKLEHLVHEVHEASEDHEETKLRRYFSRLQGAGTFLVREK